MHIGFRLVRKWVRRKKENCDLRVIKFKVTHDYLPIRQATEFHHNSEVCNFFSPATHSRSIRKFYASNPLISYTIPNLSFWTYPFLFSSWASCLMIAPIGSRLKSQIARGTLEFVTLSPPFLAVFFILEARGLTPFCQTPCFMSFTTDCTRECEWFSVSKILLECFWTHLVLPCLASFTVLLVVVGWTTGLTVIWCSFFSTSSFSFFFLCQFSEINRQEWIFLSLASNSFPVFWLFCFNYIFW